MATYNFHYNKVKPISFSSPHLVSLSDMMGASQKSSGGGFDYKAPKRTSVTTTEKNFMANVAAATGVKPQDTDQAYKILNYVKDHPGATASEITAHIGQISAGKEKKGKSITGFLGNTVQDVIDTATGIPMGIYEMGKAGALDIKGDITDFHGRHGEHTGKILHGIADNYKQTYGNGWQGFKNSFYEHPIGPILDVATLFTAGSGAAVKGGKLAGGVGKLRDVEFADALKSKGITVTTGAKGSQVGRQGGKFISLKPHFEEFGVDKFNPNAKLGISGRLVKMGQPVPIQVRSPAALKEGLSFKAAKEAGKVRTVGTTRANPALKYRQLATRNISAKLPTAGRVETSKLAKFERRYVTGKNFARLFGGVDAFGQYGHEFSKLKNAEERTAANVFAMYGSYATPKEVAEAYIRDSKGSHDPHIVKLLEDDKVNALYDEAVKAHRAGATDNRIVNARNVMVPLAQYDATLKRLYDADKIRERELMSARAVHGDDELNKRITTQQAAGEAIEPIYVPHRMNVEEGMAGSGRTMGATGPGKLTHENRGVLHALGHVALNQDLFSNEFRRTLLNRHAEDIHMAMVRSARAVPIEEWSNYRKRGYTVVKIMSDDKGYVTKRAGEFSDKAEKASINSPAERGRAGLAQDIELGDVDSNMLSRMLSNDHGLEGGIQTGGKVLVVKKATRDKLVQDYIRSGKLMRNMVENPLKVWKAVVLGYSPRNFVTNFVGNSIMTMFLASNPARAMQIVFNSMLRTFGPHKVNDILHMKGSPRVSDAFMRDMLPQHIHSTFARSELNLGRSRKKEIAAGPMYHLVSRHEQELRRAMAADMIRNMPEVQESLRRLRKKSGKKGRVTQHEWEQAFRNAARRHDNLKDNLSERVDNALGNYRDFSHLEQGVRKIMPFYSWYRHAARTGREMALNRPTTTNFLYKAGTYGSEKNKEILGDVPEFMRAFVPYGSKKGKDANGDPQTMIKAINTGGLNPYHAIPEMALGLRALLGDNKSQESSGELTTFLNPFAGAAAEAITGKSLLTGRPVDRAKHGGALGDFALGIAQGFPQYRMGADAKTLLQGTPTPGVEDLFTKTGRVKKPSRPVFGPKDKQNALIGLYNFLGLPEKNVDLESANAWKARIDAVASDEFAPPKPKSTSKKKKKKKYNFKF